MLLPPAVATAGAREGKKGGRVGIPLQRVLAGSSDLQRRTLRERLVSLCLRGLNTFSHVALPIFLKIHMEFWPLQDPVVKRP